MPRSLRSLASLLALGASACGAAEDPGLLGLGTLEFTTVDVAPTVAARVERVFVEEGASVRAGDTLAVLTQPALAANIARERARAEAAVATLVELERGTRSTEMRRAEAELAAVEADAVRASDDLRRLEPLAAQEMVTPQQLRTARSAAEAAEARRDALRAALEQLREGTRAERVAAARAEVAASRAGVAGLEAVAADLVLVAPIDGVVLTRAAEPGEVVPAAQAAFSLGDVRRPWVRVYVGPGALATLQVGTMVEGVVEGARDRRFTGRVASLATAAEFTPRVALTERERRDLLFAVRIAFDDTTGTLKAGLPVTVRRRP